MILLEIYLAAGALIASYYARVWWRTADDDGRRPLPMFSVFALCTLLWPLGLGVYLSDDYDDRGGPDAFA